jgi:hypothetical protein
MQALPSTDVSSFVSLADQQVDTGVAGHAQQWTVPKGTDSSVRSDKIRDRANQDRFCFSVRTNSALTEARTLPAEAGRKLPKNRTLFTIQLSPEEY